ncbi:MAG: enoyl-CoA hydratase/isomerase family protein [Byssovorax sp.]
MSAGASAAPLQIESVGEAVVITVDRPATRNAIDGATAQGIAAAIARASADPAVRGVVLAASGPTYLSGGDLNLLAALVDDARGAEAILALGAELAAIEQSPLPVIAAVSGDVFGGGCEIVLLCDLVIVEEHAAFAFRHAKMGLSPAWGGMTRLVERVGPIEAARLLFTAEKIDASEALRLGLVNEVVARGAARTRALARVARIAENPRDSVAALKRTLGQVHEARRGAAIDREREAFSARWGGADHRAAIQAFTARK